MEWIHAAGSLTVILGFIAGVFSYVVLRPLNNAIKALNDAIKELRMEMLTADNRRHEIEKQVILIDNKANRAHERIDDLEKICTGRRKHDEGVEHR